MNANVAIKRCVKAARFLEEMIAKYGDSPHKARQLYLENLKKAYATTEQRVHTWGAEASHTLHIALRKKPLRKRITKEEKERKIYLLERKARYNDLKPIAQLERKTRAEVRNKIEALRKRVNLLRKNGNNIKADELEIEVNEMQQAENARKEEFRVTYASLTEH